MMFWEFVFTIYTIFSLLRLASFAKQLTGDMLQRD
jgi:hypothetical protein